MVKWIILAILIACAIYVHLRGRIRHTFLRQVTDHSTFMAPINVLMYAFSRVPVTPFLPPAEFPELETLRSNWRTIRDEAIALAEASHIKASDKYDDAGFNSFFRTGWKRFYLKWYDEQPHPSALKLCPRTVELLRAAPHVKAAAFTQLPPGSKLGKHRDPFAGSLRYHLGLITPNDDRCWIRVDGQPYRWAQALNRFVARTLLHAGAAPNAEGDRTGGINRIFKYAYAVRRVGKRLKERNRRLYYAVKWSLLLAILAAIFVPWRML